MGLDFSSIGLHMARNPRQNNEDQLQKVRSNWVPNLAYLQSNEPIILSAVGGLRLERPHAVVLGIVLHLGQTESLHQRRDIHAEAAAQALLQPVPPANRILR